MKVNTAKSGYPFYLFDYDGTICHSQPAISHSLKVMLREKGFEPPSDKTSRAAIGTGKGLAGVIGLLLPAGYSADAAEMQEMIQSYRANYIEEGIKFVTFFDGVEQLFRTLRSMEARIIIASNKNVKAINDSLIAEGILHLVDLVIGEGVVPPKSWKMKPDTMIFDQIITKRFPGITKTGGLMIGDTPIDIQFAHNCGLDACWASFGYGNEAEIMAQSPHHTVSSLEEIVGLKPL